MQHARTFHKRLPPKTQTGDPLLKNLQQIPGALLAGRLPGLTHMQDDRQAQFRGQFKLDAQYVLLLVARGAVPVIVEADLTDGNDWG